MKIYYWKFDNLMNNISKIRNIAIIAHVDHGKTTLVDGLLKQSGTFRDNQIEMSQTTILDTGDLEKERGITISAKIVSVEYKGYKINIIDTPGHADFSGEVERTLGMADGVLLIIDAQEGPMPQTKFVLNLALKLNLKPIVIINKIDKRDVRISEVISEIEHLFLDIATHHDQLEFPVYYAIGREGKAFTKIPDDIVNTSGDLTPIFDAIIEHIPSPGAEVDGDFQMLVSALDWDSHQGKYAIGRIERGEIRKNDNIVLINSSGVISKDKVENIYVSEGLGRVETNYIGAGEIIRLTGVNGAQIGDTIAAENNPEALPAIEIEAPTLQITIGSNTSPFAGREGIFTTSRQIAARLAKELETNVSLRVIEDNSKFVVSGRGELHLSILIETMRREGFEMEVGRPTVVTKIIDGIELEPFEELSIDVSDGFKGIVSSELGCRRAEMLNATILSNNYNRLNFKISTRTLLGLRNILLTKTKGTVVMNSSLIGYEPVSSPLSRQRNGALISAETGVAVTYGLKVVEDRGTPFIGPATRVYEGMVIGLNRRSEDMEINACKEKQLTNIRAASSDFVTQLVPFTALSLEETLDFIEEDELIEVTPLSLRIRKKYLTNLERRRNS